MRLPTQTVLVTATLSIFLTSTGVDGSALESYFAAHPVSTSTIASAAAKQTIVNNATLDDTLAALRLRPSFKAFNLVRQRVS